MAFNRQHWNYQGPHPPETTDDNSARDFIPITYLYEPNQLGGRDRSQANQDRQLGLDSEYRLPGALDQNTQQPQRIVGQVPRANGQQPLMLVWEIPIAELYRNQRFTPRGLPPLEYLVLPRELPPASTVLTYDDMVAQRRYGVDATGLDDSDNDISSYHAPICSAPSYVVPDHGDLRRSAAGIATPGYGPLTSRLTSHLVPYVSPAYLSGADAAAVRYALQQINLNQNRSERWPQSQSQPEGRDINYVFERSTPEDVSPSHLFGPRSYRSNRSNDGMGRF